MKTLCRTLWLCCTVCAGTLFAQAPAATGETTLTLDVGFGIRAVPASRVTVPLGERLRIVGPSIGEGFTVAWTRNGTTIPGATDSSLLLNPVRTEDACAYACSFSSAKTSALPSQALVLGVGPTERLLNLSTRTDVGPDQPAIGGFVVAAGRQQKKIIVRAVGPSLSLFGVPNPLRAPALRIFDAQGKVYDNGYAYPAVVGGLTYEKDLADSLTRCGAFPLAAGTRDVVVMMPFGAGSYTAQVTSADGTAGTVLVEVYEVP